LLIPGSENVLGNILRLSMRSESGCVLNDFLRRLDTGRPVRGFCARSDKLIQDTIKHKISSFPTALKWFIY